MKQVLTPVVEIVVQKSQFTLNWDLVQFTPPPPQLKFGQDLALWVLITPVYPPPPTPQIEIWTGLGTLSFDYPSLPPSPNWNWTRLGTLSFDYPSLPPPPIEIWTGLGTLSITTVYPHPKLKLDRTRHFEFWLPQFTPHPPKLKFGQDLVLWVLTTPVYLPPPEFQGARMWRLISVSPVDTFSFLIHVKKIVLIEFWKIPAPRIPHIRIESNVFIFQHLM